MKRKLYAALFIFAAAGMITACGTSFKAEKSTVYVTKQGTVIGADIEDFNEDYYDEEELKNYITESVDNYVASNGDGSVELKSFQTVSSDENGITAQLYLNYTSYIDYALFNDITFFAGSVQQAQAEGYEFDQKFQSVEDGSLTGEAGADDFLSDEELKVVIIGEETNVKIDGTILYLSSSNAEPAGRDEAQVHYDIEDPQAQPVYIIYKLR